MTDDEKQTRLILQGKLLTKSDLRKRKEITSDFVIADEKELLSKKKKLGKRAYPLARNGSLFVGKSFAPNNKRVKVDQSVQCIKADVFHKIMQLKLIPKTEYEKPFSKTRCLRVHQKNELFFLRSFQKGKTLQEWMKTKTTQFDLMKKDNLQLRKFFIGIMMSIFKRHIFGFCDNQGKDLEKHILIEKTKKEIYQLSFESKQQLLPTEREKTLFELLNAHNWSLELQNAVINALSITGTRDCVVGWLERMHGNIWLNVNRLVYDSGLFSKVNVLCMQLRMHNLYLAIKENRIK